MEKKVVYVKSEKNPGLAILLVILFGPFGMFYSTITGALIMLIVAPILGFLVLVYTIAHNESNFGSVLILEIIIFYITCMIWAASAANKHNRDIQE